MPRRAHGYGDLSHGDVIVVQYDRTQGGPGRTRGKRYVYLTTENMGRGPQARVRDVDTGEHRHMHLFDGDMYVSIVGREEDGVPGFDDFELPYGQR